jgi:SAM-dependent methyltransferase
MGAQSVGQHYRGQLGSEYFAWQSRVGSGSALLDRWKFQDYAHDNAVIVDFGCGAGDLLAALPARRRIGVEPNNDARQAAAAKGLEVFTSAAELPREVADVVISNHALEHTLHPVSELRALRQALKPNGKLVIWLPLDDWHRYRDSETHDFSKDINHHLYTWTPLNLFNLLQEAGLRPMRVRVVSHAWPKGFRFFYKWMPKRVFAVLARIMAILAHRHQVMAIGYRDPAD